MQTVRRTCGKFIGPFKEISEPVHEKLKKIVRNFSENFRKENCENIIWRNFNRILKTNSSYYFQQILEK